MATPIPPNQARVSAWQIAAASGGRVTREVDLALVGRGITTDSRAVVPGSVFVALRGERFDGHEFVARAEESGAAIVVVARGEAGRARAAAVVEVDDTLHAWGAIARLHLAAWRRSAPASEPKRVIAITGSAGKTTTKELVRALASELAPCHATAGNLNNRIGLPSVVLGLLPHHRIAVLEMGMSVPGEIAAMAAIAPPDVAVVTNVGLAHAGGVGGTRSDVGREKGALFEALVESGAAVTCADDPAAMGQLVRTRARDVRTFGRTGDYAIVDRVLQGGISRLTVRRPGHDGDVLALPLAGEAQAIDLCAAVAAVEAAMGKPLSTEEIARALARFSLPGRQALRALAGGVVVIDDSYNANPASFRAAIELLAEVGAGRRKIAVFGEMKELGDVAASEHIAIGEEMARAGVALVVGCGGALVERGLEAARAGGARVTAASDARDAGQRLAAELQPGDVVLVKGSRGAETERAIEVLIARRGVGEES